MDAIDFFNNIPDSILGEILKRLPVKSILTCTSVQKSWYNFIRTPIFIYIHLNYNNSKPNYLLFETRYTYDFLLHHDNQNSQEFRKLNLPSAIPIETKWLSTSYSLICFSTIFNDWHIDNYSGDIFLFNPLIQKYKTLPYLPTIPDLPSRTSSFDTFVFLAFGYVPHIYDYRVVKIVNYYDDNKIPLFAISVYSLSSNSWTTKTVLDDIFIRIRDPYESVFVNGIAYWRTWSKNNGRTLLCFDVVNGVLRNIPLPKVVDCCDPSLKQFGQSVAYFTDHLKFTDINIWILRGDPMNEFFWEKKFSVSLPEDIRTDVLGIRNNGELILSKLDDCDLVSYNCEDDEVKDFVSSWNRWPSIGMDRNDIDDDLFEQSPFIVHSFVEGLVLLDAD